MFTFFKIFISLILLTAITFFVMSFFVEPPIPSNINIDPLVLNAPKQSITKAKPFSNINTKYKYDITPLYNYEMDVLVISHGNSWGVQSDPLNTHNMCAVWGRVNTKSDFYLNDQVKGQSFWCAQIDESNLGKKFNYFELSNNHFLPANHEIEKQLDQIHTGDQVQIRGFLVQYSFKDSGGDTVTRMSSTTRFDQSDMVFDKSDSSEIIYITSIKVLQPNPSQLFKAYKYSLPIALASLIVSIVIFIISRMTKQDYADFYSQEDDPDNIRKEVERKLTARNVHAEDPISSSPSLLPPLPDNQADNTQSTPPPDSDSHPLV